MTDEAKPNISCAEQAAMMRSDPFIIDPLEEVIRHNRELTAQNDYLARAVMLLQMGPSDV